MEKAEKITVEIAYTRPEEQVIIPLEVTPGTTVEQAVRESGVLERFPEIDLAVNKLGIFGKMAKKDAALREGDRVEIYRPLIADPKEVRKRRAAAGKTLKKGAREGEGEEAGTADA